MGVFFHPPIFNFYHFLFYFHQQTPLLLTFFFFFSNVADNPLVSKPKNHAKNVKIRVHIVGPIVWGTQPDVLRYLQLHLIYEMIFLQVVDRASMCLIQWLGLFF